MGDDGRMALAVPMFFGVTKHRNKEIDKHETKMSLKRAHRSKGKIGVLERLGSEHKIILSAL